MNASAIRSQQKPMTCSINIITWRSRLPYCKWQLPWERWLRSPESVLRGGLRLGLGWLAVDFSCMP
jgi:hypothetical protein